MRDYLMQYKKDLKRRLQCIHSVKYRLLERFDFAAKKFLEEHPFAEEQELEAAFGPPEEMAAVLMCEVTQEEHSRYRRNRRMMQSVAGIVAVALLLFTIYIFFLKEQPMTIIDDVSDNGIVFDETINKN